MWTNPGQLNTGAYDPHDLVNETLTQIHTVNEPSTLFTPEAGVPHSRWTDPLRTRSSPLPTGRFIPTIQSSVAVILLSKIIFDRNQNPAPHSPP